MPKDTGYIYLNGKLAEKFIKKHKVSEKVKGTFSGTVTTMTKREALDSVIGYEGADSKNGKSKECHVEIALDTLDNPGMHGKKEVY